jgi:NTE family protein
MADKPPRVGLVLSGGGARGAYEAGIIRFVREDLAGRLRRQVGFDVITGTSVGAINACFLAATADQPASQGRRLCDHWASLEIEQLIALGAPDLWRASKLLFGKGESPRPGQFRYGGILDTSGLERFVFQTVPWRCIHRNLCAGHVRALAVAATRVGTGHTVVFIQVAGEPPAAWSRNPLVRGVRTRIGPRHALASAAIPLLFPAVKIKGHFYTDGGLRQNTPMSPAIRLGADRLLVVTLKHLPGAEEELRREDAQREAEREEAFPNPFYIAGKALDALTLDATEYDFDRMARLNAILDAGTAAFGPEFVAVLNRELCRLRGAELRRIHATQVRPSMDIGEISSEFVRSRRYRVRGRLVKRILDRIAGGEAAHESDLLSYLLFDGNYCRELTELGYRDAKAREDELAALFETG